MLDHLFWAVPSRIVGGWGCRRHVAPLLRQQGRRASLIVTDRFFTRESPFVTELQGMLAEQGIDSLVFDGGIPDPTVDVCMEAQQTVRDSGWAARIDNIVSLGGGSNMDLAKVLALTLKFGGRPQDYVGEGRIPGPALPHTAMATTAGTGSEITPGAILVDPANATKVAVMANDLRPSVAVVDPELTLSCPPKVTAEAGLDALTHAVESYVTQDAARFDRAGSADPAYSGRNELTRLFAEASIRLCFQHLPRAFENGSERTAREGMVTGSLYAALSYGSAGLNAVHGLAYALAGLTHASHGSTNAVLLPYVVDALVDSREVELAAVARLAGAAETDDYTLARRVPSLLRALVARLNVPTTLAGFGVAEHHLNKLVVDGLSIKRLAKAFPIQPADEAYRRIVQNAYSGRLDTEDGAA